MAEIMVARDVGPSDTPSPDWIPTTERLPEIPNGRSHSDEVVVRVRGGAHAFAEVGLNSVGGPQWRDMSGTYELSVDTITHWMLLPPSPMKVEWVPLESEDSAK